MGGDGGVGAAVESNVEEVPRLGFCFCMWKEEVVDLAAEFVGKAEKGEIRAIDRFVQRGLLSRALVEDLGGCWWC